MTYDRQVSTTFSTAIDELVTKLTGMTGWSNALDERAGGEQGRVIVQTPVTTINNEPEYFTISSQYWGDGTYTNNDLQIEPTYEHPSNAGEYWTFSGTSLTLSGVQATDDNVDYWLQYTADYGFAFYFRRTMGDGNDGSWYAAAYQYDGQPGTEYWNPRNANQFDYSNNDRIFHYLLTASSGDATFNGGGGASIDSPNVPVNNQSISTYASHEGLLNPDSNFTDYVWWSPVLLTYSSVSNTDTGMNPNFARVTDPLFIEDGSGTDLNTGDVVQDSGGADEWEIVDYHNNRATIRMV